MRLLHAVSALLVTAITVANAAPAADQILAAAVADSFAPFPLSKRGNTCPTGLNANGTYDWQKCFQGDTPAACKSVCDNVAPDAKNCPGLYAAMCATVVCAQLQNYGDCLVCLVHNANVMPNVAQDFLDGVNALPAACVQAGFEVVQAVFHMINSSPLLAPSTSVWGLALVVALASLI